MQTDYAYDAAGNLRDVTDPLGTVMRTVYDDAGRKVATIANYLVSGSDRYTDSDPKERFRPHAAGLGGYGGSSYVDSVAFRARDMNGGGGWRGASDGTLENRVFYCQNWRQDVVALWQGQVAEWVKYSSYGTPFGIPQADTDSDGDFDSNDDANISGWGADPYDVRADYDFDGDVDIADASLVPAYTITSGQYAVSSSEVQSRRGYAGYENGFEAYRLYHNRARVMDSLLERNLTRTSGGLSYIVAVDADCESCNRMLDLFNNDQDGDLGPLRAALRALGCRIPTVECVKDLDANGISRWDLGGCATHIKIKCGRDPTAMLSTLNHEYIHALDNCALCQAWIYPGLCSWRVCKEARAYHYATCRNELPAERAACVEEGIRASICGGEGGNEDPCCRAMDNVDMKPLIQRCVNTPETTPIVPPGDPPGIPIPDIPLLPSPVIPIIAGRCDGSCSRTAFP